MLFRVWKPNANCYDTNIESFRIDNKLNLWCKLNTDPCISDWSYADPKNFVVEFNTGITLADGTETFFGDIIRYKTPVYKDGKYGPEYVYSVLTKDSISKLGGYISHNSWSFFDLIELVGNIHETELTDAMKVWVKE